MILTETNDYDFNCPKLGGRARLIESFKAGETEITRTS
jgi:hypothetical protein